MVFAGAYKFAIVTPSSFMLHLKEIALPGIIVVRAAPSGIVTLLESSRMQIATPSDISSVFAWLR